VHSICTSSFTAPVVLGLTSIAAAQSTPSIGIGNTPTNVLLVVADDLGVDMVRAYGEHPDAAPTPNIDALASSGVLFRNAYATPTCSPTRAGILTGRGGARTLLGTPIREYLPEFSLLQSELTLAEVLRDLAPSPIPSAAIGKWHLGSTANGDALHPNLQGFGHFAGTLGNLRFGDDYFQHAKVVDGVQSTSTTYATTEQVDDALASIGAMSEPWFVYLAFNAPHAPFHAPPPGLHSYVLSGNPDEEPKLHYRAAVEAMDTEIGRLLATMDPGVRSRTTVIFVGDNGSPAEAVVAPSDPNRVKGTLYEGGVRVPLIVAGPGVRAPGRECQALVSTVDLFPTVAELAGVDPQQLSARAPEFDGRSLRPYLVRPNHAPMRQYVVAERFVPNGPGPYIATGWMIRDARWKLIERPGHSDLLFDMEGAGEDVELLAAGASLDALIAYARLRVALKASVGR
jgi:arylsulfatase A-like enzyme